MTVLAVSAHTYWVIALIIGLAAALVVAGLLAILIRSVASIERSVDGLLAVAVLVGLVLNAGLGWWWADPLAGYVILFYGLKEGRAALRHG